PARRVEGRPRRIQGYPSALSARHRRDRGAARDPPPAHRTILRRPADPAAAATGVCCDLLTSMLIDSMSYGSFVDQFLDVPRALTRSKLDDAKVGEASLVERIFAHDGFDVLTALACRHDDSTIPRYLPPRDDEITGSIVLLQESDVRGHRCVDFIESGLVG